MQTIGTDTKIEAVAKALADSAGGKGMWEYLTSDQKERFRDHARAAMVALASCEEAETA